MDSCVSLWQGGSLFFFFLLPWVKERKREREERGIVIDALWKTRGNTLLMLGKTLPGNLRIISLAAEEEMDADVLPGNFDDDDEPFLTINVIFYLREGRGDIRPIYRRCIKMNGRASQMSYFIFSRSTLRRASMR